MPIVKKTAHKSNGNSQQVKKSPSSKTAWLSLPDRPNIPSKDMYDYCWLFYGAKGIGKTSLSAEFPDALIIMLERLRFNLPIRQIPQRGQEPLDWTGVENVVELILDSPTSKRPKTVVFDTVDRLYMLAKKHTVGSRDELEPWEWDVIDEKLSEVYLALRDAGVCVVFTSHSKVRNEGIDTLSGATEYNMTQPTCTPRCFKLLKELVDFGIFYGYNGEQRVLSLRGHQYLWASCCRSTEVFLDPEGNPVAEIPAGDSPKEAFANLVKGYNNKLQGIVVEQEQEEAEESE